VTCVEFGDQMTPLNTAVLFAVSWATGKLNLDRYVDGRLPFLNEVTDAVASQS
jgi:hypothetical protein